MEKFLEMVTLVNTTVSDFVWGPIMLALLVGAGVFLTFRTGWLQVRQFGFIMKNTIGSLFRRKSSKDHGSNLSPFQAVTTASEGGQAAQNGKDCCQPLPALAQAVFNVVHGSALVDTGCVGIAELHG